MILNTFDSYILITSKNEEKTVVRLNHSSNQQAKNKSNLVFNYTTVTSKHNNIKRSI